MDFRALASDYDGTLACDGQVAPATVAALQRLKDSGGQLIMVTGRKTDDLADVFPQLCLFDRVVGENGAVLHSPATGQTELLTRPVDLDLVRLLRERGVPGISIGVCVIGISQPFETIALEAMKDLGLELSIIFNKGSVMILPAGVTKGTGLAAAATELGLALTEIVGVGDGENDHDFLETCGLAVAVADAVPALKERAGLITSGGAGAGVRELVDRLLSEQQT